MEGLSRALRAAGTGRRAVGWHRRRRALSLASRRWTNFDSAQGIRNSYVWSLAADGPGNIWAGTWGGGLFTQKDDAFDFAPGLENFRLPMPALLFLARRTMDRHAGGCALLSEWKIRAIQRNCRPAVWRRARHRAGQVGRAVVRHGREWPGADAERSVAPVQKKRGLVLGCYRVPSFCGRRRAVDWYLGRWIGSLQKRENSR